VIRDLPARMSAFGAVLPYEGVAGPFLRRFSDAGTHDANHALRRPASEKRQGTKSRWGNVGRAATMGISPRAQASMWWNVAATRYFCHAARA
jgi:hypothetical protein